MKYFLAVYDPFAKACADKAARASTTCKATSKTITTNPIYHTLQVTADILAIIAGIIAVIMIIISGLSMVTAQGNSEAITTSRNRIIYSVVGLIIIAAAWSITALVVNKLVG